MGCGAVLAVMRENSWMSARFRRAAWLEAVGRAAVFLMIVGRREGPSHPMLEFHAVGPGPGG